MSQVKVRMVVERETKGAVLYKEVDEQGRAYSAPNSPGCKIGNLYIRKSALNGAGVPGTINIVIDY